VRYLLKDTDLFLTLSQLGHLTVIHLAIVKSNHRPKLSPANVHNNLFPVLRMLELHPWLEFLESHVC
jgi:hypothetical protein